MRHVGLSDSGQVIGRTKEEGRNSYGGVWYKFYGKASVWQTGPRTGQAVLQLYPGLELLHHGSVCQGAQVPEICLIVHWMLLLGAM